MNTRKQTREETFAVSPDRLFSILHSPAAIRQWWSVSSAIVIAKAGGIWAATWGENEDHPDFTTAATIRVFEAPERMVLCDYQYHAQAGELPFNADFETEFLVVPHEDGATLRVTQDGFPAGQEADAYFAACENGWRETFKGIREYLAAADREL